MITDDDVKKLAVLARLNVSQEEAQVLKRDLGSILGYIEKLKQVNVDGVEPMTHAQGIFNVFRNDILEKSLSVDEALKNAPDKKGQFIGVPLIKEG